MNDFSFALIIISGFLFSFIFESLALEFGFGKKFFKQYYSFLLLPFLYMVSFLFFPLIFSGNFVLQTRGFYGSIYFWFSVSLLVGGLARFIFDKINKN